MNSSDVYKILASVGAVITDSHIVYTSGRHGSAYVNKDAVYPHTQVISDLCREMSSNFNDDNVNAVIGPAIGGVILSQWTAYHLSWGSGRNISSAYAEKAPDGSSFIIGRGYDKLLKGCRVLVVEDVLTTGGSVAKVVESVRNIGGYVVGVSALCNRGGVTSADIGNVPKFTSLVNISLDSWEAADCPLCRANVPINTEVGKGREFLASKNP